MKVQKKKTQAAKKKKKTTPLSFKLREHFVPVVVAVIIILFSLLFARGIIDRVVKISKENKELKSSLSFLLLKANRLEKTDKKKLDLQISMMEKVFPSKKPSLMLLATLSSLAREEDVVLSGIELAPGRLEKTESEEEDIKRAKATETGKLKDFTVDFSVEGKLSDVSEFVARIERVAPVMKIESFGLKLQKNRETGLPTGRIKASLTVMVFYQAPPQNIGPVEQKLPDYSEEENALLAILSEFETEASLLPSVPVGQEDLFGKIRQ
jgi:Tfp pilus assembly protein PilO